jgi:hypothetical protein
VNIYQYNALYKIANTPWGIDPVTGTQIENSGGFRRKENANLKPIDAAEDFEARLEAAYIKDADQMRASAKLAKLLPPSIHTSSYLDPMLGPLRHFDHELTPKQVFMREYKDPKIGEREWTRIQNNRRAAIQKQLGPFLSDTIPKDAVYPILSPDQDLVGVFGPAFIAEALRNKQFNKPFLVTYRKDAMPSFIYPSADEIGDVVTTYPALGYSTRVPTINGKYQGVVNATTSPQKQLADAKNTNVYKLWGRLYNGDQLAVTPGKEMDFINKHEMFHAATPQLTGGIAGKFVQQRHRNKLRANTTTPPAHSNGAASAVSVFSKPKRLTNSRGDYGVAFPSEGMGGMRAVKTYWANKFPNEELSDDWSVAKKQLRDKGFIDSNGLLNERIFDGDYDAWSSTINSILDAEKNDPRRARWVPGAWPLAYNHNNRYSNVI